MNNYMFEYFFKMMTVQRNMYYEKLEGYMSVVNIPQNCWLFFLVINFLAVKVEIDK